MRATSETENEMPLREDGTTCSKHVFEDCGLYWFQTEDERQEGPFKTCDEADDAFKRYCTEFLEP